MGRGNGGSNGASHALAIVVPDGDSCFIVVICDP